MKDTPNGIAASSILPTLLTALLLAGCGAVIRGVSPVQPIPTLPAAVSVTVTGTGRCGSMEIDWGDQSKSTPTVVELSTNPVFTHVYGLGGGKTVTVEGKVNCNGKVRTRFVQEPAVFTLGFVQRLSNTPQPTCRSVPNHPGVRAGELVRITTVPASRAPGINFGCPFNGCVYDADGNPGSSAGSSFPFPGLREYSLVLKVGAQVVQGGTNMRFTATQSDYLQVCLNDFDMTNNTGGYEIDIRIDQLGP